MPEFKPELAKVDYKKLVAAAERTGQPLEDMLTATQLFAVFESTDPETLPEALDVSEEALQLFYVAALKDVQRNSDEQGRLRDEETGEVLNIVEQSFVMFSLGMWVGAAWSRGIRPEIGDRE